MPRGRPLRNARFLPYRRLQRSLNSDGAHPQQPDVEDALVDRLIQDHLHPEDLLLNTRPEPNEPGAERGEEGS